MSIIKEAAETKEQLQLRLDSAEDAYNSRKAEMEDDSFWSQMSRGAKMSYLSKLKSLEDDITRITRRLARAEEVTPEPEVAMAEGLIGDKIEAPEVPGDFDIEDEWYHIRLAQEKSVGGMSDIWAEGDDMPCRKEFCIVKIKNKKEK